MCLQPGSGRGRETELRSDEAEFGVQHRWPWRDKGLVFGKDGIMTGEGVKKGKGRIKAPPYESDDREMPKSYALQYWFQSIPHVSSKSHWIGIIHFLRTFQGEEFGDQSKNLPKKRQTSRASYQWWAMDFGCFIRSCCSKLWFWRGEELWGDFSQLCSMVFAVCFIVFLKSCVSCQALAQAVKQNSALTFLNLIGKNIGDEGAKAWCLVRMRSWGEKRSEERQRKDQDTARLKMTLGKWQKAMQCSVDFQMHSSGWNLWWQVIGVFLRYLACIGQILVEKRNTS